MDVAEDARLETGMACHSALSIFITDDHNELLKQRYDVVSNVRGEIEIN